LITPKKFATSRAYKHLPVIMRFSTLLLVVFSYCIENALMKTKSMDQTTRLLNQLNAVSGLPILCASSTCPNEYFNRVFSSPKEPRLLQTPDEGPGAVSTVDVAICYSRKQLHTQLRTHLVPVQPI
ncbi:MAG: hypothetical protein QW579_02430, partial [Desulfurococcaceae archaeon]